jgi:sec-independent protein translocase protein TatA
VFNVGPLELIVVLIVALIVLGPQRLPDVARSLGRGMREFRSALDNPDEPDDEDEDHAPGKKPAKALEKPAEKPVEKKPEGYQKEADSSEPSSSSSDLV